VQPNEVDTPVRLERVLDQYRQFLQLVRRAPEQDAPFFGEGAGFRDLFNGKLITMADPATVNSQFPPIGNVDGQMIRFDEQAFGRGRWADHLRPVRNAPIYREVRDVIAGGDIRRSQSYEALLLKAESSKPSIRYLVALDAREKIDRYFVQVGKLVESIRKRGYRGRRGYSLEEADQVSALKASEARPVGIELTESEIGMAVDADGTLVRVGPGNHRFAIVHQLGISPVRVEIRLFHVRWLRQVLAVSRDKSYIIESVRKLGAGLVVPPASAPATQQS
jgi:hypothetical protein